MQSEYQYAVETSTCEMYIYIDIYIYIYVYIYTYMTYEWPDFNLLYLIYTPTIVVIHSHGVITLLTIYKIPKLKYVFAQYA